MKHWQFGIDGAMPETAFTPMADCGQERGECPQLPSGAPRGIAASPRAGGAQTEHQSCAGHSLAHGTLSSRPQPVAFHRPWEMLFCSSCTVRGTHRRCSLLSNGTTVWECSACAGEGTGKRQTSACCWAGARPGLAGAAQSGPGQIPPARHKQEPVPPHGWNSILLTFLPSLTASSTSSALAGVMSCSLMCATKSLWSLASN